MSIPQIENKVFRREWEQAGITRGSQWKRNDNGRIAVVIHQYHDLDTNEVTSMEIYMLDTKEFLNPSPLVFFNAVKSNIYKGLP